MDVEISLAHEVLDLVQPRFELLVLKDRVSALGAVHNR